jgi:hypothetical protein
MEEMKWFIRAVFAVSAANNLDFCLGYVWKLANFWAMVIIVKWVGLTQRAIPTL